MRRAMAFAAVLFMSLIAAQAQVYKWTDAEGKVHYGSRPPADGQPSQTLDISSQPTPAGGVDNVRALERAKQELRELRAAGRGVPVGALDRPVSRKRNKKTQEPVYIGYTDQIRIDTLNSDSRRLSSSTFGSAGSRAREIRVAKDELRQIYRRYGLKAP